MAETQVTKESRSVFQRISDIVFGYDFFVSYRWFDGHKYATALVRGLSEQGFECFLDSERYVKGDNWRLAGRIALRNTSRLLVVCSPEVLESDPVAAEVIYFQRKGRRVIPIDIAETLANAPRSTELRKLIPNEIIAVREDAFVLASGPSARAINEIRSSFDLTRQARKRVRWLTGATVLFACVAILAGVGFWQAENERVAAISRGLSAQTIVESERQMYLALLLAAKANEINKTPLQPLCGPSRAT